MNDEYEFGHNCYNHGLKCFEYDKVIFSDNSKLSSSAKLYRGIKFRRGICLVMQHSTFIGDNCVILVPSLIMESGSQINAGTILAGRDMVHLHENVVIGYQCLLLTASDSPEAEFMNDASAEDLRKIKSGPISIEENAFIGSKSIIMPDVGIAPRTVVCAMSYVDRSLPRKNWIYRGNQPVKERDMVEK